MDLRQEVDQIAQHFGWYPQKIGNPDQPARYALLQGDFSLCSQKTRSAAILTGHGVDVYSLDMRPMPAQIPQCYDPAYVRLRLKGRKGAPLVASFSGSSGVSKQGFDPCVVPTLVDFQTDEVITDSRRICLRLLKDAGHPPMTHQEAKHLSLVDETPHVALLYGATPNEDRRPTEMVKALQNVHAIKAKHLRHLLDRTDQRDLIEAYKAKLSKENHAKQFVLTLTSMSDAIARTEHVVSQLKESLTNQPTHFLGGDRIVLSDLVWAVSLIRLVWLGQAGVLFGANDGPIWPYFHRLCAQKVIKVAVLNWPGQPPSPHLDAALQDVQRKFRQDHAFS